MAMRLLTSGRNVGVLDVGLLVCRCIRLGEVNVGDVVFRPFDQMVSNGCGGHHIAVYAVLAKLQYILNTQSIADVDIVRDTAFNIRSSETTPGEKNLVPFDENQQEEIYMEEEASQQESMATENLSGKKSHDLGEYDPLTQADSEESEDELVLDYQKNGSVRNGTGGRRQVREPDSDVETEVRKIKERHPESRADRHSPATANVTQKTTPPLVAHLRTAGFLFVLFITVFLVLMFAFLIPCPQKADLQKSWNKTLGQGAGVLAPVTLYDVNSDGVLDVLLSYPEFLNVTSSRHERMQGFRRHRGIATALSGVNGDTLWTRQFPEEIRFIQCGTQPMGNGPGSVCLLTGTSKLQCSLNASSGIILWELKTDVFNEGTIASPAILLPDLDGDGVKDLLVLTIGDSQPELSFLLFSGENGSAIGVSVSYNTMKDGKLVGPQVHITRRGAVYILFGFGNVQAVALRDIFAQATNRDSYPPTLQDKDPEWERKRPINSTDLISIYSGEVEYLQMVRSPGQNYSDLLITTRHKVTLLRGQDLEPRWIRSAVSNIQSPPVSGHYNLDGIPDFLLQETVGTARKKVEMIDGSTGRTLWNYDFPCRMQDLEAASVMTSGKTSAFLFWAGKIQPQANYSNEVSDDGQHVLYLMHSSYPQALLELENSTAVIMSSAVGISEFEKDAVFVTMKVKPGQGKQPGPFIINQIGLRWAMAHSRVVQLSSGTKSDKVRKFLSKLEFSNIRQQFQI
ncbi:protein FAM234B [Protopterus annectens]|uniref:protein FAM234B n=1 Tax=Protopterus annectens TaxID=7888 RepID=UPI001CFB7118|nr:protein FAM234B [Protopterus annectens]